MAGPRLRRRRTHGRDRMTLVLDSGGVSALAANKVRAAEMPLRHGWPAVVPAVVLAESFTGDHRRDHATNRFLRTCRIVAVDEPLSRSAAHLRTATGCAGTVTTVDAVVAALAAGLPDPVVVTTDPDDLTALLAHADRPVTIAAV